jgi:hypothetical protein
MNEESEKLIKEYETTQEMIKHYEILTMRFAAISQTNVFILVGLAFTLLKENFGIFKLLFPFVLVMVVAMHGFFYWWFQRHRVVERVRINNILRIEAQLGWKQHGNIRDELDKIKKTKSWPIRYLIYSYLIGMPIVLLVIYIVFSCYYSSYTTYIGK